MKKREPSTKFVFRLLLTQDLSERGVDILSKAFQNDPFFKSLFPNQRELKCKSFFRFVLQKSKFFNEKLFALFVDNEVQALGSIEMPSNRPNLMEFIPFIGAIVKLLFEIPLRKFLVLNQYMQAIGSMRPKQPHHYLGFVAVNPSQAGRGFGRDCLENVHRIVEADSNSLGIALDTENPENVPFYEHFNYRLVGVKSMKSFNIYSLFREN